MAARIAKLIGEDPSFHEKEAALIDRGMKELLWLKDEGWFAEWKDLLGDQAAAQEAAAWTFYHTMDSSKEVKSLTVRAIANEVVIGLMSVTLQRP